MLICTSGLDQCDISITLFEIYGICAGASIKCKFVIRLQELELIQMTASVLVIQNKTKRNCLSLGNFLEGIGDKSWLNANHEEKFVNLRRRVKMLNIVRLDDGVGGINFTLRHTRGVLSFGANIKIRLVWSSLNYPNLMKWYINYKPNGIKRTKDKGCGDYTGGGVTAANFSQKLANLYM